MTTSKQEQMLHRKRDPELTAQVVALTKGYLNGRGITFHQMAAEINALLPVDCRYTRAMVNTWTSGQHVPRPEMVELLLRSGKDHPLVEQWARPLRKAQLAAAPKVMRIANSVE